MTHTMSVSQLRSEFDDFLYASVGEENGMRLSVLSALARLELDPWQEAEQLARLSTKAATMRLASLIAAAPHGQKHQEAATLAADLVRLLPQQGVSNILPHQPLASANAFTPSKALFYAILLNLLFMALTLGSQYTIGTRHSLGHVSNAQGLAPVTNLRKPHESAHQ